MHKQIYYKENLFMLYQMVFLNNINKNTKKITEFAISNTLILKELFNGDENIFKESYSFINDDTFIKDYEYSTENDFNPFIYNKTIKIDNNKYRPSIIRGIGVEREGFCSQCKLWFKLKTSSYWYHMNYKHGISAKGIICPEPKLREQLGRTEGFCKECNEWIILGTNNKSIRFGWFKHWQKLHCKGKSL